MCFKRCCDKQASPSGDTRKKLRPSGRGSSLSDETLYVLKGTGQVYVDGAIADIKSGSVILFPKKSKHMLRNTGSQEFVLLFTIFPSTNPDNEAYYESIEFPGD